MNCQRALVFSSQFLVFSGEWTFCREALRTADGLWLSSCRSAIRGGVSFEPGQSKGTSDDSAWEMSWGSPLVRMTCEGKPRESTRSWAGRIRSTVPQWAGLSSPTGITRYSLEVHQKQRVLACFCRNSGRAIDRCVVEAGNQAQGAVRQGRWDGHRDAIQNLRAI